MNSILKLPILITFLLLFSCDFETKDKKIIRLNKEADSFCSHHEYGKAKDCYTKLLKLDFNSRIYFKRGLVEFMNKEYGVADRDFGNAYKNGFSKDSCLYYSGWSNYYDCLYEEAFNCVNSAINLNPNNKSYYFLRGQINIKLMDTTNALLDFQRAIKLGDSISIRYYKAYVKSHLS
jgi:tetratricopeptide (TPR) repeat protein